MDDDGYLFVEGRLDDVIVRGGENISPGEIEDVLRSHPQVADVAVLGLPDDQWGEQVVAAGGRRGRAAAGGGTGGLGEGAAALDQDPASLGSSATPCPTTTPASCCAAC